MATIVIEDWMIQEARLSGLELLAFALIHGCTQKGDGCWHGGYERLAERIGGKQRGTIIAVNNLQEYGAIEKFDAMIDGKPKKALRTVWDSAKNADAKNAHALNADAKIAEQTMQKMQSSSAKNAEPSNNKDKDITKKKIYKADVEELYALYPTVCPTKGRPIKKGDMCRRLLETLLRKMDKEVIRKLITDYVSVCTEKGIWMSDFATFLHQRPEFNISQQKPKDASGDGQAPAQLTKEQDIWMAAHPTKEEIKKWFEENFYPFHLKNEGETDEAYFARIRPDYEAAKQRWIDNRVLYRKQKY